ncbi:Phage capsid scaffolding protein [Moraxella catarrhalis]|uniref:Phage capsid scaffolding protein n=1 Tax=Moraxella catarrhalis TaxID=480 RepID=A0A7Z1A3T5_MORCA|nr:Phage capsid scaffolding protein [Moraxella catarrhalis]
MAVAGQTTDGREIAAEWIEQMAASYDPNVYGARINVEHFRGFMPDGDFGAYGDVLALKAETIKVGNEDKLALFAQILPNDKLKELNAKNQKIYTSVEIDTNFAKTGKAYLVGLAVTDSPASLGTEMLKFAANAQVNPLAHKKQSADNLFTAAIDIEFDFSERNASLADSIVAKLKEFFSEKEQVTPPEDTQVDTEDTESEAQAHFDNIEATATAVAAVMYEMQADYRADVERQFATLTSQIEKLNAQLDIIPQHPARPDAVSTENTMIIDC